MRNVWLLFLGFTMMACVPTSFAPGASSFSPFDLKAGVVSVTGPGVWYVRAPVYVSVPRNISDGVFEGFYGYDDVSVGYKQTQGVTWMKLNAAKGPEGWQVGLARQEATREISSVRQEGDTRYYKFRDSMSAVLSVTVPNGVRAGQYPISFEVGSLSSSDTNEAEFVVEVASPK
jgi:hypothetical protein